MMVSSAFPDLTMMSVKARCLGSSSDLASSSAMPSTPFIGVRISWLILARNSDLARSASSARCCASLSSCSRALSSVMSVLEPNRCTEPSIATSRPLRVISWRRLPSRWVTASSVSSPSPVLPTVRSASVKPTASPPENRAASVRPTASSLPMPVIADQVLFTYSSLSSSSLMWMATGSSSSTCR